MFLCRKSTRKLYGDGGGGGDFVVATRRKKEVEFLGEICMCVGRSEKMGKQKCMPAIHWAISHLILAELLEIVFLVAYSSKITRSKEKKNETLMSRVPVVDAPRLHVRGDKLIVEFQLAGMFSCDGLRDVIYISEV
ncbi:hypothetical protein Tco_0993024 [Tanacetum coccineum]|uniref:Uncharacterized protein n=1 Tax=Tanacetum coccineum TaxID=301880 RepID=A0ABQ5F3Z6_9ASTR